MKTLLSITLLIVAKLSCGQSQCNNIDFENGNTEGWITSGDINSVNKDMNDPYGHFPLSVSGFNAVKLGNKENAGVSSIKREIYVTENTKYFIYAYSIVFLGYPHEEEAASYVKLKVTDASNHIVPCTEFIEHAQSSVNDGFFESDQPVEQNIGGECCYPIYYKPWTIVAIDLSPYLNQTLTFELSSSWCVYSVDWGYAYVDAYCADNLIYEYSSCDSQTHFIGTIDGFQNYVWNGPGIVSGQGTNQIEVNQPGTYTIDFPNTDISCSPIHLEIEASVLDLPGIPEAAFTVNSACVGVTSDCQNISSSVVPITGSTWVTPDGDSLHQYHYSEVFDAPGTYPVTLIVENEIGCIDTLISTITVLDPPVLDLGPDLELCPAYTTILKAQNTDQSLHWSTGENAPEIEVNEQGYYWAELTVNGCADQDTVYIDTTGAYLSFIPNVFTPDGNITNDHFDINANKYSVYDLVIVNRWGNVVFQSSDPVKDWDGTINGDPAVEGVYLYKLTFQFDCMPEPQNKQGTVSLFRKS